MKTLIPPADLDVVGLGTVKAGVPVDVPDEMAGVAPDPRREDAMIELRDAIEAHNHLDAQARRDEISTLEMGYGLLAQGWTLAPTGESVPKRPELVERAKALGVTAGRLSNEDLAAAIAEAESKLTNPEGN